MAKFQLTIIGSGTMMPTKARHPSCYLLEINTRKILLDIGHTSVARLIDLGIDLHSIDTLFISHFHTDHIGDMLPFVHARFVDDGQHPERQHQPLTIIGPKTIQERYKKLREVSWPEPYENYPIKFIEGARNITIDNTRIEIFDVKHVEWFSSVGIKITCDKKSLIYTGDIGSDHPIQNLKKMAQNIDLLLIEAGHTKLVYNHFTIEQIIEIVRDSHVKRAIATHVRDTNLSVFKKQIKNCKNIILAKDLMKVKI